MINISFIVPVYKVEKYLPKCLDSILLYPGSDIEVICVYDDKEADNSYKILLEYSQKDKRVKIQEGRNKGLSGARNDGIKIASGKLVWFVDSDDAIMKNAVTFVKKKYDETNFDILIIGTEIIPKVNQLWLVIALYTRNAYYNHFKNKALFKECGTKPFVWRNIFQRDFLMKTNVFFDEENLVGEDMAFQMDIFPYASRIIFVKDKLYQYLCNRQDSLQNTYVKDKYFQMNGHIQIVKHVFNRWQNEKYNIKLWNEMYKWAILFLSEEIPNLKNEKLNFSAMQILQEIEKHTDVRLNWFYKKMINRFEKPDILNVNTRLFLIMRIYYSMGFYRMCLVLINLLREKVR